MKNKLTVSTDNIFADLGLNDAKKRKTRSDFNVRSSKHHQKSNLPRKEIATILQISVPKASSLVLRKINDFSNDTLMNYLTLLAYNIEIHLTPKSQVSKSVKRGKRKVKNPTARQKTTSASKALKKK